MERRIQHDPHRALGVSDCRLYYRGKRDNRGRRCDGDDRFLGAPGILTSSARYKDNIKPMDKASEAVLSLKPVTFHYKKELDPEGIPQFGLVAEQVVEVDPDSSSTRRTRQALHRAL